MVDSTSHSAGPTVTKALTELKPDPLMVRRVPRPMDPKTRVTRVHIDTQVKSDFKSIRRRSLWRFSLLNGQVQIFVSDGGTCFFLRPLKTFIFEPKRALQSRTEESGVHVYTLNSTTFRAASLGTVTKISFIFIGLDNRLIV